MEIIKTQSTSANSASVNDVILGEPGRVTRKIFRPEIVKKEGSETPTVKGKILHQRKVRAQEWEDCKSFNLSHVKSGEEIQLELKSSQIEDLYVSITQLKEIANKGIPLGNKQFKVFDEEEMQNLVEVESKRASLIRQLVSQNYTDEFWEQILEQKPEIANEIVHKTLIINRQKSLDEFEEKLGKNLAESLWQKFFSENTWIFGYGLNYKFLEMLEEQPDYGSTHYDGAGGQRGDFLMNTAAKNKFTVLVEIKRDCTKLLASKPCRSGTYEPTQDLIKAVSQLQVNCNTWQIDGSQNRRNLQKLSNISIHTSQPKGILVIGNSNEFEDNFDKSNSFEIFRQNLKNPEIITFDELLMRASYIVRDNDTKN